MIPETADASELCLSAFALAGLLLGLRRLRRRHGDLVATRDARVPESERVVARASLQRAILRATKLAILLGIGLARLALPAGEPVPWGLARWGLVVVVFLLLADELVAERESRRLLAAVRRELDVQHYEG